LKLEAFCFGPIQEPDHVIRVINRAKNQTLLRREFVRHDARLQLHQLLRSSPHPNHNRRLLLLERLLKDLLHSAPPALERRLVPDLRFRRRTDSELLHDVTALEHVAGPLVGFGASSQTLDGKHFRISRRRIGAALRCSIHDHVNPTQPCVAVWVAVSITPPSHFPIHNGKKRLR